MTAFASLRWAASLCLGAALVASAPASAQLAPQAAASAALSDALRTLSRTPNALEALLAAGEASLKLEDFDAALGFFRRAEAVSPRDGRAKAGLGAVMVHQRQPLEALRLFAQAEQAGGLSPMYLAERGLAYDLIGDNARAQRDYATALAAAPDEGVSRRLALSQAIAGDQRAAEATLLPFLQRQDRVAYRTRAFTLAIGGRGDEAVSIAEAILQPALSNRMAPYLRYMPRLTRAQQAAAANLGAFPRAGDIGRDDPQIASYAATLGVASAPTQQTADSRLVPSGAPLGARPPAGAGSARPRVAAATPAPAPIPPAAPVATPPAASATRAAPPAPALAQAPAPAQTPKPRPAAAPGGRDEVPERARAMLLQHPELARDSSLRAVQSTPAPSPIVRAPARIEAPVLTQPSPAPPALAQSLPPRPALAQAAPAPALITPATPTPTVVTPAIATPLATVPPTGERASPAPFVPPPSTAAVEAGGVAPEARPVVVATLPPAAPATATPDPIAPPSTVPSSAARPNLSEAFGDLRVTPPAVATPGTGAVDITKIQPRRASSLPKPAAPKPPPVPSREWVQVATGRSTSALAFDWRRLKKEAGGALDKERPSTAEWGRTNRLVIGPFATPAAADKIVVRLKDKGIDAFRFTSDEGQAVEPLGAD